MPTVLYGRSKFDCYTSTPPPVLVAVWLQLGLLMAIGVIVQAAVQAMQAWDVKNCASCCLKFLEVLEGHFEAGLQMQCCCFQC